MTSHLQRSTQYSDFSGPIVVEAGTLLLALPPFRPHALPHFPT